MPRPFRFNLERVLDYRIQLADQAAMALAKATAAHQAQSRVVSALEGELASREEAMAAKKSLMPAELWLWRAYRERLAQDIKAAALRLRELAAERERCRLAAVERSKEKKLLEQLKSKKAMRHVREENLGEQKENDEMATIRYVPPAL